MKRTCPDRFHVGPIYLHLLSSKQSVFCTPLIDILRVYLRCQHTLDVRINTKLVTCKYHKSAITVPRLVRLHFD